MKEEKESLIPLIEQSIRDNWERPALTNFRGVTFQYRDLARKVAKLHLLYEHAGLQPPSVAATRRSGQCP